MEDQLIDNYNHVNEFVFYTPTNIPGKGCDMNLFDSQISAHCSCVDGCENVNTCVCLSKNGKNYQGRRLTDEKIDEDGCFVECNSQCSCSATNCANRSVQFGPAANLKIVDLATKGYGLISTSGLPKGAFVCEYAGEIIGEEEAIRRRLGDDMNYIFTLNEFIDNRNVKTIVDATCIANIGRYINHSCDPNCVVIPVRVDSIVPKLCIFSRQNIGSGEEITYKYGECSDFSFATNTDRNKLKLCLCGSSSCLKYLPFNP